MKKHSTILTYILLSAMVITGCKKDWLEIKPDKALVVPQTLKDFQAILNNEDVMNTGYSFAGNPGSDNYYVAAEDMGNLTEYDRNLYLWADHITWFNEISNNWNSPFSLINSANIVLDGLATFDQQDAQVKSLKGQAMFFRAFAYYNLAQVFCRQYETATAKSDAGLPLRLNSEVNVTQQRSSLQDVYDLIISDLEQAVSNLPETATYNIRPTKAAAQAMLAKVYLNMQNYDKAKTYADATLLKKPDLIDFNNTAQVSHLNPYKFPANGKGNPEIIFHVFTRSGFFTVGYLGHFIQANSDLYNLYEETDLRKEYFFAISNNRINYISSYDGTGYEFGGLATNEIYLIRAECNARTNKITEAQNDLNKLLKARYKKDLAPLVSETDPEHLLDIILRERRKELPHTGNIRWEDLRRLNLDPKRAINLTRTVNNQQYQLPAKSPKYVLNIPNSEIRISGIEQNIR